MPAQGAGAGAQLTDNLARARRVVFRGGGLDSGSIHVMGGDGREPRLSGDDSAIETMPSISPDGKWVVFTSDRSGFNDEWPTGWFPQPHREPARSLALDVLDVEFAARPFASPQYDGVRIGRMLRIADRKHQPT